MNKLTTRNQQFIDQYVIDFNGAQAAIRAGYSVKTARAIAYRLLTNVDIVAAINEKKKALASRLDLTAERVLMERSRLAFFDPRKLFNADGSPKGIGELDDDAAAAIASLDVVSNEDGSTHYRYRFSDKSKSLDALEKHLGLYEKNNEQKLNPLADLIKSLHENNQVGMPANANP